MESSITVFCITAAITEDGFSLSWTWPQTSRNPQWALPAGALLPDQTHRWLVWSVCLPPGQGAGTQQKSPHGAEDFPQWDFTISIHPRHSQACGVVGSRYSAPRRQRQWPELSTAQMGPVSEAAAGPLWEWSRPGVSTLCGSSPLRMGETGSFWLLITGKINAFFSCYRYITTNTHK